MNASNGPTAESEALNEALVGMPEGQASKLRGKYAKLILWRLAAQTQDMDRLFRYDDEFRRKVDRSEGIPMNEFDEDAVVLADNISIGSRMPAWAGMLIGALGLAGIGSVAALAWSLTRPVEIQPPPAPDGSDTIVRIVE